MQRSASQPLTTRARQSRAAAFKPACASSRRSLVVVASANQQQDGSSLSRRDAFALAAALGLAAGAPAIAAVAPPAPPPLPAADAEGKVTVAPMSTLDSLPADLKQVYSLNRRIQAQNRVPDDFPAFIRSGFDVLMLGDGYVTSPEGVIYRDYTEGTGEIPSVGQEVIFHYTGYNESGTVIDSSYRKGRPAQARIGVSTLIPGFAVGLSTMRVGQQRRIIVPPALGPPVGPSTFFSAKQCEVFDVQMLAVRQCKTRQMIMYTDVVCE